MANIYLVGLQWGDEGKGKITDALSHAVQCVARFQGGSNAGHTININGKEHKLSMLPSAALRASTDCYIGSGVVMDLHRLEDEISTLESQGIAIKERLKISPLAGVVLDIHKALDQALEQVRGEHKVGTTLRGIGFAYQDKVNRLGIRVRDLANKEAFTKALKSIHAFYAPILRANNIPEPDPATYADAILASFSKIEKCISQSSNLEEEGYSSILFEGAQGALLDVTYGTYPFVTSSNTIPSAVELFCRIQKKPEDHTIGVLKAYSTRVGEGPFLTEDTADLGSTLRERGMEFGTVTSRARRCGPLDLPLIKYAAKLCNVNSIALTKLDVLSNMGTIKVCTGYKDENGKEIPIEQLVHLTGQQAQSVHKTFIELPSWNEDISNVTKFEDLPPQAQEYVTTIVNNLGIEVSIISTGPERNQLIPTKHWPWPKTWPQA